MNAAAGDGEIETRERGTVYPTAFNKGKQKVLSVLQNLASQDIHGEPKFRLNG